MSPLKRKKKIKRNLLDGICRCVQPKRNEFKFLLSLFSYSHIFWRGGGGSDDSKAQQLWKDKKKKINYITATIYILRKICFLFSAQHFHIWARRRADDQIFPHFFFFYFWKILFRYLTHTSPFITFVFVDGCQSWWSDVSFYNFLSLCGCASIWFASFWFENNNNQQHH